MKKYKHVYIEITNACNLTCSFCPQNSRKIEFMSENSYIKILEEVKDYTDYIHFHIMGEPLLHPNLELYLNLANKAGLKVNITTNGTLLLNKSSILLEAPALRQINFSLHSYKESSHIISNIDYFNNLLSFCDRAMKNNNPIVCLRLWNLKQDDNGKVLLETKENKEVLNLIEKHFSLTYKIEEEIHKGNGIKLAEKIFLSQSYRFQWPDINLEDIGSTGYCRGLKDHFGILVDGTVVPCCLDSEGSVNLGNIHKNSLEEILNTERSTNISVGFSQRKLVEPLCRKCGFRRRF